MSILRILCYNSSLVPWTVVRLTTAMFKPLIFSWPGFNLSYTTNIFILMSLYDFWLLPAQVLYNRKMGLLSTNLLITSRHGPHKKHISPIVACLFIAFLRSNDPGAGYRKLSSSIVACMLRTLPSNDRCLQSHSLARGPYATLWTTQDYWISVVCIHIPSEGDYKMRLNIKLFLRVINNSQRVRVNGEQTHSTTQS
jgi:hypothetical protein